MTGDPLGKQGHRAPHRARRTATWLGRTQHRRRIMVCAVAFLFVSMCTISALCAMGVEWAPPLWLVAFIGGSPLLSAVTIVSGNESPAPQGDLDDSATARRNRARSNALTLLECLLTIPILYLILGAVLTGGRNENMAYAGGCMVLTAFFIGSFAPAMQLVWNRSDTR